MLICTKILLLIQIFSTYNFGESLDHANLTVSGSNQHLIPERERENSNEKCNFAGIEPRLPLREASGLPIMLLPMLNVKSKEKAQGLFLTMTSSTSAVPRRWPVTLMTSSIRPVIW